jgi:hypothetical protein
MKKYTEIEKEELRNEIRTYVKLCKMPYIYEMLVEEAITSTEWDFTDPEHYDGCTGVSELHFSQFPPDCLAHDFYWRTGRGGVVADRIFKDIMKLMGRSCRIIKKRYTGVRIAWFGWYKWKHKFNKNVQELTPAMKLYADVKGIKIK